MTLPEQRVVDGAAAVRRVRWIAVLFTIVQFWLFEPGANAGPMPFPKLPVGAAVALALIVTNLLSLHVSRTRSPETIRRFGIVEVFVDTSLAATMMVLFGFDEDTRMWPILTFPIIEGSMRVGLRGAMGTWAYGAGVYVIEQLVRLPGRDDPSAWVGAIPWGAGILLFVALGTGTLASRLDVADERVMREKDRLRLLSEIGRAMNAERDPEAVHQRIVEAGVSLLGFEYSSLYEHVGGDTWRQLAAVGLEGTVRGAAEQIPAFTRLVTELDGATGMPIAGDLTARASTTVPEARFLIATPIRIEGQVRGLLLLSTRDPEPDLTQDSYDVLELLAGHASTAMRNADLMAAESRTIAELRELDTMKDDFLSILTHELRSPMTSMAGSAELLRDRWADIAPDRRDEFLASIQRNTNRLSALIQDVFDALKAERTELPVNLRETDLLPLVVEAAEQEVSRSKTHTLRFDVDTNAPPVLADADRVSQILHNLLSNAVKYSPDGGTVTISMAQRDDTVAISVRDEGLGIPASAQARLFGKFQRLHGADRSIRGTGLGLYLAKTLVDAMGGTITVDSREGQGSTFTVCLPIAGPAAGERSA